MPRPPTSDLGPDDPTFEVLPAASSPSPRPALGREVLPVFATGQVVAGRFRIVRFLAQGGMGQVYEADDLELHEDVALKTVRAEIAGDERTLQRFKREIHLARRVTHPNVCRTFDLFRHADDPEERPLFVLAMELLNGETLAERIRRAGAFTPTEALPLIRQMAAALSAAHRVGVVHRDFNPRNVMLVAAAGASGEREIRAVVTDFGLAQPLAEDRLAASVTGGGVAAGTPAYMAPEQVEGSEVGPAADLYAFGVVLYEMLTARWPFVGDSPLATAAKRLTEAPPSPRLYAPHLEPRWEATILRCLARTPAERFASVTDAAHALEDDTRAIPAIPLPPIPPMSPMPLMPPSPAPLPPRWRLNALAPFLVLVLVALLLAGYGLAAWRRGRTRPSPADPAGDAKGRDQRTAVSTIAGRPAVAVLGFKNLSGRADTAWLSTAFAEMLSTELAAGRRLRTIPGETVARAKAELALPEAQSLGKESLARLRRLLDSDFVVLGSVSALGPEAGGGVRLDVRLQDATSGETLSSFAETGTAGQIFAMATRAGAVLRGGLGVTPPTPDERQGVRATLPADPEAARLYAEGLARRRAYDNLAARDLLARAVAAQPDFSLAHAALASAWGALGYDARATAEAKRAFELAPGLPREEQLLIEGQYREVSGAWAQAAETYQALWRVFPDNLEYGLRLAAAETSSGNPTAALRTLADLRALPAPGGEDPRVDLAEAKAAGALSDARRQRQAAAQALAGARERGARLLIAEARYFLGTAAAKLGRPDEALAHYQQAAAAYQAVGDRAGVARLLRSQAAVRADRGDLVGASGLYRQALAVQQRIGNRSEAAAVANNLAIVRRRQGDLAGAAGLHRRALATFRELGARDSESRTENSLANVLADQGDLAGARAAYERSLAVKREIGDRGGVAAALSNIANLEVDAGHLAAAERLRLEALAVDREIGSPAGVASDLTALGELLTLRGDLAGAEARHREALSLAGRIGDKGLEAWALFGLGDTLLARGDLAAAHDPLARALALWSSAGEEDRAADARLGLARLDLERGDAPAIARAERAAREIADRFAARRQLAEAAAARRLLARALLARGDAAAAQRTVATAAELGRASQPLATRLELALTGAQAAAAAGDREAAHRGFDLVRRDAERAGFAGLALAARIARARLDVATAGSASERSAARTRLTAARAEAGRAGFTLLARAERP